MQIYVNAGTNYTEKDWVAFLKTSHAPSKKLSPASLLLPGVRVTPDGRN